MSDLRSPRPDARLLWTAYAVAALSFATTLTLPYVGEEGIYTITAMEMKVRGDYFVNTLYGTNHGQPPLLNWLDHPARRWPRLASMCSSRRGSSRLAQPRRAGSCWRGSWQTSRTTHASRAFAALVYLTSDALLYHGWLAYTYPVFAFFAFAAIACLWIATAQDVGRSGVDRRGAAFVRRADQGRERLSVLCCRGAGPSVSRGDARLPAATRA